MEARRDSSASARRRRLVPTSAISSTRLGLLSRAQPLKVIAERYRVAASVGHGEDHVRRLDDRGHRLALLEAELAGRFDGDRGDDALAVDVGFDDRDRCALVDSRDGAGRWLRALSFIGILPRESPRS
jgi:hypothetical protein